MFHTDVVPRARSTPATWCRASWSPRTGSGDDVLAELARRGHQVTRVGPWSLGRLCAVARDPETGLLSAGANPRGDQGYAVGR